jgi:MFS family permease
MSAFAFGQAFGPAVCAALAAWFGLVVPIFGAAAFGVLAAFAIWQFLPEETATRAERPRSDWRVSLKLIGDPRLSGYLIFGFALATCTAITAQIFGLFTMDRLHVTGERGAEFIAAGFMVNALMLLVTQMALLPRLKAGPRTLMIWGGAILTCGVILQIFAPSLGALLVSQAVQGLGAGLARPGFTGGASLAVEPEEQGAAAGMVATMQGAGFIFSPILGAVAYEHLGMTAPLCIALVLLAAMLGFALLSRRLRAAITEAPPSDS